MAMFAGLAVAAAAQGVAANQAAKKAGKANAAAQKNAFERAKWADQLYGQESQNANTADAYWSRLMNADVLPDDTAAAMASYRAARASQDQAGWERIDNMNRERGFDQYGGAIPGATAASYWGDLALQREAMAYDRSMNRLMANENLRRGAAGIYTQQAYGRQNTAMGNRMNAWNGLYGVNDQNTRNQYAADAGKWNAYGQAVGTLAGGMSAGGGAGWAQLAGLFNKGGGAAAGGSMMTVTPRPTVPEYGGYNAFSSQPA